MKTLVGRRSFSVLLLLAVGFGLTLSLGRSPLATAGPAPPVPYDWLQMNGDPQHSGNNTKETILGASSVANLQFLFQVTLPQGTTTLGVDGAPAALTAVETPNGTRDLIFSTTKSGNIVASDAATGALVWSRTHPNTGAGGQYCNTSPAIDPNRLYVYSYGLDGFAHKHQVGDGAEIIDGVWPQLTSLKPQWEKATGALGIATARNGSTYLYVAHGGYRDDQGDYQGHVTAINLGDGTQNVFNSLCSDKTFHLMLSDPDCKDAFGNTVRRSAIWGKAGVIYDDVTDRIYMATANGPFDANSGGHNWGDSILALNPDGTGRSGGLPMDSYTPTDFADLERVDRDLGSTGPAIIPSSPLAPPGYTGRLVVQGGKDKKLRLVDLTNMSGQGGPGNIGGEILVETQLNGLFSQPAVWINPADGTSWVFVMNNGTASGFRLEFPGGAPMLVRQWQQPLPGKSPLVANNVIYYANGNVIRAADPLTGLVLWSDTTHVGSLHWQSPVVFNGRVYLHDDSGRLTAWALPPAEPPTQTPVVTTTGTSTRTNTPTLHPTSDTGTPTITPTGTVSRTSTSTRTATPTKTPTRTATTTRTATPTKTPTGPPTATNTRTPANTATQTPTNAPTVTPGGSVIVPALTDFRDVRRGGEINAGPDLGATEHPAINFTGTTGAAGDAWITVYDAVPATADEDSVYGSVSLSADVLIQAYNNKKAAGLLALFNEAATRQGLSLMIINAGNSDALTLGAVNPATGVFTTLATVSLGGNILENVWYRLTMDVAATGDNVTVTARVFRHTTPANPNSPIGAQINSTLSFSGARPAGVDAAGEVGIVAYAQGVVNSSVTNFTIKP